MAQIPKGGLVKGPYNPICRDCAMYFSTAVFEEMIQFDLRIFFKMGWNQPAWRWGSNLTTLFFSYWCFNHQLERYDAVDGRNPANQLMWRRYHLSKGFIDNRKCLGTTFIYKPCILDPPKKLDPSLVRSLRLPFPDTHFITGFTRIGLKKAFIL